MQYVNDDMEDLFRKAAEKYPLEANANWDKVARQLQQQKGMQNKTRHAAWKSVILNLAASVILLIVCTTYISKTGFEEQRSPNVTLPKQSETVENKSNNSDKNKFFKRPTGMNANDKLAAVNPEDDERIRIKDNNLETETTGRPFLTVYPQNKVNLNLLPAKVPVENERIFLINPIVEKSLFPLEINGSDALHPDARVAAVAKKIDSVLNISQAAAIQKNKIEVKSRDKKLYLGIMAGPDFSSVNTLDKNGTGYSVGLLAGFQFSRKLSLEAGVLWDKKEYYSSGKNFKASTLSLPEHSNVLYVDGYCRMFELPLNVKYNWVQQPKHNFFATAGISSYIMQKEDYNYMYERYNIAYYYNKQYKNASTNWMSIVNLGLGYERKVGNAGNIRIEPYWKIPLKGVGVGELPINSKGVFIGFTRPIH